MSFAELVRREWGAATFIVTVAIGIVVVPLALAFNGPKTSAVTSVASPSPSVAVSAAASPSAVTSPTASVPAASPTASLAPAGAGASSPVPSPTH